MLIALLLTLCPVLGATYMFRCMITDARDLKRWGDARQPAPKPVPAPAPPVVDDRPVYDVVELDERLVELMKRDGYL